MSMMEFAILSAVKKLGNGGSGGGGGGGEVSAIIKPLTITKDGTYSATSGKLEYGMEVKFKEVMTEADFESYVTKATPIAEGEGAVQYALFGDWTVMTMPAGEVNIYGMINMQLQIGYYMNASAMMPDVADGWMNPSAMTAIDYNEIPGVTFTEETQMSADLETTGVFFILPEKVDAYAPVTVRVVKTALEPIKAGSTTGQLRFKVEDPNGELTSEYELYAADAIDGEYTYLGTFPKSALDENGEFYIKGIGIGGIDTNKCFALKAKATSELAIMGFPTIL